MRGAVPLLVLLVVAAPLAAPTHAGGPASLAAITPDPVLAAPNATVTMRATLTNVGSVTERFLFHVQRVDDGIDWSITYPDNATLAPGASTLVEIGARTPAEGGSTGLALHACPESAGYDCAHVTWSVRTPLVLELVMLDDYSLTQQIFGQARVRWLDGAPVNGSTVDLREQWALLGALHSEEQVVTDATGNATFIFSSPTARLPGAHHVSARAGLSLVVPGAQASAEYTVS